jgi:hypothetical protein
MATQPGMPYGLRYFMAYVAADETVGQGATANHSPGELRELSRQERPKAGIDR